MGRLDIGECPVDSALIGRQSVEVLEYLTQGHRPRDIRRVRLPRILQLDQRDRPIAPDHEIDPRALQRWVRHFHPQPGRIDPCVDQCLSGTEPHRILGEKRTETTFSVIPYFCPYRSPHRARNQSRMYWASLSLPACSCHDVVTPVSVTTGRP
jgi:hypothetical protein